MTNNNKKQEFVGQNSINRNPYNSDINSTRNTNQTGLNINQNPYINQNVNQVQNQTQNQTNSLFNSDFIKGALIGAVATYILTNKNAQENIFSVIDKAKNLVTAGVEEMKERIEDAKAAAQARN
ncbi:hypothetical protein AFAEC_1535 [Aliarcobacter faecis]|uniref:hypothetical protein n=1 Tax=Aliarcobacter faecis TaxID=1564138 RepID=UPI0004BC1191|nr:hypothetical protein [Aliarcobacter faecis]QKF73693.1 hypothetical protein AFAEC_1535 [Aliarcobacter faecis]